MKYSVVFPVRNGAPYIKYALESLLSQATYDLELIVSDNYSTDSTVEILKSITDPRLRIIKPVKPLSMHEHYEFAISECEGQWIQLIGADDALFPWWFDQLETLTNTHEDADVITWPRAYYFWPGVQDLYADSVLRYEENSMCAIKSSKRRFMSAVFGFTSMFSISQMYTGSIFRKTIFSNEQKSNGNFFNSIIPDVYSSVFIGLNNFKILCIGVPLSWVGTSASSMGRDNRIYTEQFSERKSVLAAGINAELHSLGIEGYYLLECMEAYYSTRTVAPSRFLKFVSLVSALATISRLDSDRKQSINLFKNHLTSTKLLSNILLPGMFVLALVLRFSQKIVFVSKNYLSTLLNLERPPLRIVTNNRKLVPDILAASDYVASRLKIGGRSGQR
jgi:glycosyltransferase involved in cell wall biosynthesis